MTLPFIKRSKKQVRYGMLTVLATVRDNGRTYCTCKCRCGKTKRVRRDHLTSGKVISCGCYRVENNTKHGSAKREKNHPIYRIWIGMKSRCYNENNERFADYGGRDIIVCDEWRDDYPTFRDYMLALPDCPSNAQISGARLNRTIDRIKNDRGYGPGNVRWGTREQQDNNRRVSRIIEYEDFVGTIKQATDRFGLASYRTTLWRIDNGWSVEKALRTPGAI